MSAGNVTPEAVLLVGPVAEEHPFRYFVSRECLSPDLHERLLKWFETDAPWRLVETDFYEQFEFSLLDVPLPRDVASLTHEATLASLRDAMSHAFNVDFENRVMVVAHKLVAGQHIAIHNDYLEGEETHRLTLQLNRGLSDEDGGLFMLFNSFDSSDVHKILRPAPGSVIGFEIGPRSFHAVSRIHDGERYTIVFSFYAKAKSALLA